MYTQEATPSMETSTAKAHRYMEPVPSAKIKRTTLAPLPPSLNQGLSHQPSPYITTSGTEHCQKHHVPPMLQPMHKKAPGSWKINYVEDTISALKMKPWRRPLTMGNQRSEMKDKFLGEPEVTMETQFDSSFQPFKLSDHHRNGPSMEMVEATRNEETAGRVYYPKDRGILGYHGDMYLTTTQKDHRRFTQNELKEYPFKKYATFWECEGYPKSWGHGSSQNPLPRDCVPREDQPMRDELIFKTATTVSRLPKTAKPVPHRGLTTEVRSNFTDAPLHKKMELFHCPVPRPLHRRDAGQEELFAVPKMYETEYQYIGQKRPVVVL